MAKLSALLAIAVALCSAGSLCDAAPLAHARNMRQVGETATSTLPPLAPLVTETPLPVATEAAPAVSTTTSASVPTESPAAETGPINVPQISLGPEADVTDASSRQLLFGKFLTAALQQAAQQPPVAAAAVDPNDTLQALASAYQVFSSSNNVAAMNTASTTSAEPSVAQVNLYVSALAHAASSQGLQLIQSLMANDTEYAQADQQAGANRATECTTLTQYFSGASSSISPDAKACICDPSIPYSHCRAVLANSMYNSTAPIVSTVDPNQLNTMFPNATVTPTTPDNLVQNSNWQPNASTPVTTMGSGFTPYNPLTGEISVGACLGEGFELCIKGSGYLPSFKTAANTVSGSSVMEVTQCLQGQCSTTPLSDWAAVAASQLSTPSLELSVSLCLGLPGLIDVLNEFGISLCLNLLTADFYGFQGPLGQLSTGLNLWIVKFGAWGKIKMANGSPVCPQDFNSDMQQYACAHPDIYNSFVSEFANDDFCNLAQGQGIIGASITVDLWFWSKEWDFAQTPAPRAPFTCNSSGQPSSTPNGCAATSAPYAAMGDFQQFDCHEARVAYLAKNPDVASNSVYMNNPRGHWEQYGHCEQATNPNRVWPGQVCMHTELDCPAAEQAYMKQYPDVYKVYGGSPTGAQLHYSTYGHNEGRYWYGALCLNTQLDCSAADQKYLQDYSDVAQNAYYSTRPRAHYESYGQSELRSWNGQMCQ